MSTSKNKWDNEEKLWDSCHLNSPTKAVGQLLSQQPDQSCGTVAISTARPKLWDSCHLNSLTKAVGQLPSQRPNQSCGTVAISTAQPKLWDSCHFNILRKRPKLWDSCHLKGPTKAVGQLPSQQPNQSCGTVAILTSWERDLNTEEGRTQYMKISEKVSGPVTCVKVMSAPRVILSAYIQENMPQSDPFICCGISCRTEKADPSWKWLELVLIQSWHRVVHTSGSVCPRSWPGHGYFYTQG